MSVSMGTQAMNSILYMFNYFNQINDPESVNYNSYRFPCGFALTKKDLLCMLIYFGL